MTWKWLEARRCRRGRHRLSNYQWSPWPPGLITNWGKATCEVCGCTVDVERRGRSV